MDRWNSASVVPFHFLLFSWLTDVLQSQQWCAVRNFFLSFSTRTHPPFSESRHLLDFMNKIIPGPSQIHHQQLYYHSTINPNPHLLDPRDGGTLISAIYGGVNALKSRFRPSMLFHWNVWGIDIIFHFKSAFTLKYTFLYVFALANFHYTCNSDLCVTFMAVKAVKELLRIS